MGERLVYHSSLGFILLIIWSCEAVTDKFERRLAFLQVTKIPIFFLAIVLSCIVTIDRNKDWKNDSTLFLADVETVPNSALANANASVHYLREADKAGDDAARERLLAEALNCLNRAIAIYPRYVNAYLNRGLAYYRLEHYDKAEADWRIAAQARCIRCCVGNRADW